MIPHSEWIYLTVGQCKLLWYLIHGRTTQSPVITSLWHFIQSGITCMCGAILYSMAITCKAISAYWLMVRLQTIFRLLQKIAVPNVLWKAVCANIVLFTLLQHCTLRCVMYVSFVANMGLLGDAGCRYKDTQFYVIGCVLYRQTHHKWACFMKNQLNQ